jgi:predicted transglutaminase-like cysteine proteinase
MRGLHAARAALLLSAGLFAMGEAAAGELPGSRVQMLGEIEQAPMPSGLASLCARASEFCAPLDAAPGPLELTPALWQLINSVNAAVNGRIAAQTDEQLYGRQEYWTLPQTAGDCEDFVLLKRKMLTALGISPASLLITVVHDEHGEGHAVLGIPTTAGDLILDNRRDEVLTWMETGYKFVKRQSAANPNVWVSLARERLQATAIASAPEAHGGR